MKDKELERLFLSIILLIKYIVQKIILSSREKMRVMQSSDSQPCLHISITWGLLKAPVPILNGTGDSQSEVSKSAAAVAPGNLLKMLILRLHLNQKPQRWCSATCVNVPLGIPVYNQSSKLKSKNLRMVYQSGFLLNAS